MIKKTLCFSNPAFLSLKNQQIVISPHNVSNDTYKAKQRYQIYNNDVRTIPIEDIGVVVLENSQITITNALLNALIENNAAVICCDNSHMPSSLLLPLSSHTVQNERFRFQIDSSLPLKKQLWQQTMQSKIMNQAVVLKKNTGTEVKNMYAWASQVKSGDTTNQEARAAVYYWRNLFLDIPFFTRGQWEAPPNNLLNYGYAILRAVIARSLVGSGLLPTLGIHHHNRYNSYCLADDIMEPYRPYVDDLVVKLINSGIDYNELTPIIKRELLQIPTMDVFINGQNSPLMIAATITSASLARCFSGESRKILYPEIQL